MRKNVQLISIDRIRVLNPRYRDKKKFEKIVESIRNLGLKKPIQVSARNGREEGNYDLVCGQGRLEAFQILGYAEIPAILVEVSKEDRLLMGLVENMARRRPAPMDLINEIERLKGEGYSNNEIGRKLDIAPNLVGGLLLLKGAGEERLLDAALKEKIPIGVAIEIAKTDDVRTQRELLKAYESKQLTEVSIRTVRRLIEQRQFLGKALHGVRERYPQKTRTTAEGLVNVFRRETQRQKLMVRKAKVCEAKLLFLVSAFKRLMADEHFVTLLRAESLDALPKFLSDRLKLDLKKCA